GTLLLHYPSFVATLSAAKDSDGTSHGTIQGERGYISIPGSVSILREFTLCLRGEAPQTFRATADRHRLSYEFEAFRQLADNRAESQLNIPYLSRVALEIAIALERKQEIV
ncbi:MAG: hypothetical protein II170_01345, partial [Bacteroidaceae bacterium]|nr:hypothetical protein [Bacteroidaceae bacterium]